MSKLTVSQNSDGTWPGSFDMGDNDEVDFKATSNYLVSVTFAPSISNEFSLRTASSTDPDYDYSGTANATFNLRGFNVVAGDPLTENRSTLEVTGGQQNK